MAAGISELGAFGNRDGITIRWTGGNDSHELDRRLVPDAKIVGEKESVGKSAGAVTAGESVVGAGIESGEGDRFEWRKVAGDEDELAHGIGAIEREGALILGDALEFVGGRRSERFGVGSIIGGWDLQVPTEIGARLGEGFANVGEADGTVGENGGVRGVCVNNAQRDGFFLGEHVWERNDDAVGVAIDLVAGKEVGGDGRWIGSGQKTIGQSSAAVCARR